MNSSLTFFFLYVVDRFNRLVLGDPGHCLGLTRNDLRIGGDGGGCCTSSSSGRWWCCCCPPTKNRSLRRPSPSSRSPAGGGEVGVAGDDEQQQPSSFTTGDAGDSGAAVASVLGWTGVGGRGGRVDDVVVVVTAACGVIIRLMFGCYCRCQSKKKPQKIGCVCSLPYSSFLVWWPFTLKSLMIFFPGRENVCPFKLTLYWHCKQSY